MNEKLAKLVNAALTLGIVTTALTILIRIFDEVYDYRVVLAVLVGRFLFEPLSRLLDGADELAARAIEFVKAKLKRQKQPPT